MSLFAKMDLSVVTNRRRIKAGPAAFGLWAWGLGYCRLEETDGVIDLESLRLAFSEDCLELAAKLVEVGLWMSHCDGFEMLNYSRFNETKSQIAERRKADSDRQKHWRKQKMSRSDNVVTNALVTDSDSVSVKSLSLEEGSKGETKPEEAPEPTKAQRLAMREIEFRDAYCRGVAEGKGGPYAWPGGLYDQGSLNECIKTFGRGKGGKAFKGEAVTEWVGDWAHDFALEVSRKEQVQFYSGFGPKGFKKWLNEQHLKREAKEVG